MVSREEALNIPELQINPNEVVEDCFYYKLAKAGRLSEDLGKKKECRAKKTIRVTKVHS